MEKLKIKVKEMVESGRIPAVAVLNREKACKLPANYGVDFHSSYCRINIDGHNVLAVLTNDDVEEVFSFDGLKESLHLK